jgi:dipeptidyl aminopeptidase/acylaminoacyl peptidase
MPADVEEMADWARKSFGKEKIFVAGHSWGSYLSARTLTAKSLSKSWSPRWSPTSSQARTIAASDFSSARL